jgi:hypothetical protein
MECIRCSGATAHPVLVRSVKDIELCDACAKELTAVERQAMAPLVVAAFAQFVSDWSTSLPTEPCRHESARHFWASLTPFGDAIDTEDIKRALETLIERAPRQVQSGGRGG